MIASASAAMVYAVWLQKIVDAQVRKTWDAERSDFDEQEDDRFNNLWRDLDERQQERLWGLSSDLNTLRDRETWVEADWEPMTPKALARHPEVGLLFIDNAARLEPENATYLALALECLKAMSAWEELRQRAEGYLTIKALPSGLFFRVADALHLYATATANPEFYQQAVATVDRGFEQLQSQGDREPLAAVLAAAFATKALSLQRLAKLDEALKVFDVAIKEFTDNSVLLTARGLLKQQLCRLDAIDDFQKAVDLGTPVVWPYLEIARNALRERQWEKAISFCRLGIWRAGQPSVRAVLFDLLAIAQFEHGDPSEEVRSAFQTAHTRDPLSEEIRSHFDAFNERSVAGTRQDWNISPKAPPAAIDDVYGELCVAA